MPVFGEAAETSTSILTSTSEPSSISKDHQDLHPTMSSSYPITLKFMDVCYKVKMETNKSRTTSNLRKMFSNSGPTSTDVESNNQSHVIQERVILNGITGMVSPGEILAILGPSGSGKSTLLNALAGRLYQHGGSSGGRLTGTVLANNRKQPTKQIARRTGFVTQDDILYPHLTVRETLIFCSLLRLPNSLSKQEKISAAESVISELGLVKCENTIVGNSTGIVRGVSGGERKRVNIAHEMLINPSLLILDEPTSGLDSTAAYRLISTLGSLAQKGKTVVTSVHQPSSRVYQMFDSVLVLSEGKCLYFGKANQAMNYFDSIGFSPSFPMNPADFLLDLANGVCPFGNNKKDKSNVKQTLVSSYNSLLAPMVRASCMDSIPPTTIGRETMVGIHTYKEHRNRSISSIVFSWLNQFSILLERGIKVRRHECFDALRVFQVIAASLLAGILWWHSDYRNIQDRLGLLFSIAVFWGVLPATSATFTFPQERAIFMKERASGMYTLSSYFMAKIIGDMPMELILPIIFLTITYWMSGLKPELGAFLLTVMVILGYVLVSQGLGLAFGALVMDSKQASTVVTVTMLAFVLIGGFYVHNIPPCISWMRYISSTFYSYRLLISIQYGDGREISSLMGCNTAGGVNRHVNHHEGGEVVASCKFIKEDIEGQMHPIFCAGIMLVMFVGYRMVAYFALRCRR